MRILQLKTSSGRGGAETMLLQLTRGLSARDHEVLTVLGEPGWLADRLVELGHAASTIALTGPSGFFRVPELTGLVRRFAPDVILSHGARVNLFGTIAGTLTRVPTVSVEHGMDDWRRSGNAFALVDRFVAGRNRGRIAVSQAVGDMLVEHNLMPADRVSVIQNGVSFPSERTSIERGAIRARFGFTPEHTVLVTVARLSRPKGHANLFSALARLRDGQPQLRCLLLGDGPLREELEVGARVLGIDDVVVFAGAVDDVFDILPACDLFVLPSLREGLPVAAIEAMGMNLPVVATRVAGTGELVVDGETGLLVPPDDTDALVTAIASLADDEHLRTRLAAAGRTFARTSFTFEAALDRYEEVLQRWSRA